MKLWSLNNSNMERSNFVFLRDINFYLYSLAKDAEKYVYVDNDICLYKLRKIMEVVIKDIYKKENIVHLYTRSQKNNINNLYANKLIGKVFYNNLHRVRENCNYSVHNNIYEMDRYNETTLETIKFAFIVCGYYIKVYYEKDIEIDVFIDIYSKKLDNNIEKIKTDELNLENVFINEMVTLLIDESKNYLNTLIRDNKFESIEQMEFDYFFNIYLDILKYLIIKDNSIINNLFKFKEVCKKKIGTSDGNKVNMYIAQFIYEDITGHINN